MLRVALASAWDPTSWSRTLIGLPISGRDCEAGSVETAVTPVSCSNARTEAVQWT